ncbi:E3 ubiquitin-protein ligase synoviolin [Zea mays]|uniref:RING-type E3 ubiquitin transferase n=3 Tax=Zea mays TaxID=4577 RepID=A0A804R6R3_MAIZE|nr:E3 ubiquitin-protein ligase synoviolin [Zea mays]|eukprot:XP_008660032.1 E3 ubiquitin-protein ligase synoviolin [Zea mays]
MSVAGAVTTAAVPSRAPMSSASVDEARCGGGATAAAGAGGSPLPAPPHECAVCLSELPAGAEAAVPVRRRTLPACGHAFHADCIGRWLPLRPECPLCRRPVLLAGGGGQRAAAGAPAAWARPAATIACGFGDGRVVWSRSPVPPPDSD